MKYTENTIDPWDKGYNDESKNANKPKIMNSSR